MGLCFSRKKSPNSPPPDPVSKCIPSEKKAEKRNEKQIVDATQPAAKVSAAGTKPVFVITQSWKKNTAGAAATAEEKDKKKGETTPTKKSQQKEDPSNGSGGDRSPLAVDVPPAPVRASSCTKEEVDAILIQCGRLSRRSSGNASNENGGGHRKYSGSKRSYDFDNEKKGDEEEEWEKPISRPSPQRRTPGRERSGIRERSGTGGGRRVSRSPGRRSEAPTSSGSASDRSRQPAKMVSVPAREKGGGLADAGGVGTKMVSSAVFNKRGGERRSASPRSRSPANTSTRTGNENALHHNPQPQSLSRSSSRKAEQSPGRRNPMAEIDDNSLRGNQNDKALKTKEGEEEGVRKLRQSQTQKACENIAQMRKSEQRDGAAVEVSNGLRSNKIVISNSVREQLMRRRAKDRQPEPAMVVEGAVEVKGAPTDVGEPPSTSIGVESLNPRTITRSNRSLKRSSRDFDHSLGPNPDDQLNPTSHTSLLLEDIHNQLQHQGTATATATATAFSLPACVSKACSILEAVADLNSCSEQKSSRAEGPDNNNINGSLHGRFGRRMGLVSKGPFVESEIIVKDDLMEPSLHKYVSVRELGGEMEPQESAGSNSFIGQPWSSPREPNSIDSTDRDWTWHSNNDEEVEQQQQQQQQEESKPEIALDSQARGRRVRGGGSISSNSLPTTISSGRKKREFDHHHQRRRGRSGFGGGSGKSGATRSSSLPVAAASAS